MLSREEIFRFKTINLKFFKYVIWQKVKIKTFFNVFLYFSISFYYCKDINPENKRLIFWSDNTGYDFAWVNWYCWKFLGYNPFGHTTKNVSDIYKGIKKNMSASFKEFRVTKHTHNALDDAIGNAEALLTISKNEKVKGLKF